MKVPENRACPNKNKQRDNKHAKRIHRKSHTKPSYHNKSRIAKKN